MGDKVHCKRCGALLTGYLATRPEQTCRFEGLCQRRISRSLAESSSQPATSKSASAERVRVANNLKKPVQGLTLPTIGLTEERRNVAPLFRLHARSAMNMR